ncbi:conserved exported hypothetical protein [Hyella patelloides LEGE 07179]|uniref:DUF1579 domain-containing protein n=1 Tax=Hyella patelloides LEGE 07179 TaxID=945734 RepID=A0A563W3I9_9CYAN|nr:DUF1579 family protein [Hyella patelloides]VEP18238.1 conserved exported hypothetical protein [Hyella patelloides LEGE 07179]
MLISIKSKLKALCLAMGILAINHSAIANTEESEPSQPPPELERLEYFEGTWRCQQPAAPETPVGVFIWTVQLDLNDFWYVGNAEEIEFPDEREPINSREFLGYDAVSQKLFRFVVVGNGNSLNFTALDWQDETLVWEGAVVEGGNARPLRQEIIQDDEDKFTATYFVTDNTGEWQPAVNETCERVE